MKLDSGWLKESGLYSCPVCGKEFSKRGVLSHIWRKHEDGINHKTSLGQKGRIAWNKGLTIETSKSVKKGSDSLKKIYKTKESTFKGKKHTAETKAKISIALSLNNKGGRCKWYKTQNPSGVEFKVQGTWELKFASYLNAIDVNWIKIGINDANHSFKWLDENNKLHTYTPDFYSPLFKKYFEIKGYWWGNDKIKMKKVLEQNNINIEIVTKKELNFYLKSVEDRSGDIVTV